MAHPATILDTPSALQATDLMIDRTQVYQQIARSRTDITVTHATRHLPEQTLLDLPAGQ